MTEQNKSYVCTTCGWVYDPEQGDPDGGIAPGTAWEDIPDDWVCPVCGVGKEDFEPVEQAASDQPVQKEAHHSDQAPLVIVGSGLAGYSVVKEVRKYNTEIPILVITADGGEAYSKPMLSNAFARHHQPDDMIQKTADQMANELDIEIRTHCKVNAIDREQQAVEIEDVDSSVCVDYDRLVLALGADPRVFPAPGSERVGITTVNDLDDYRRWRSKIGNSGRVLLIGAGLIGCEFANDLIVAGFDVFMVDPAPWPLGRLLPKQVGEALLSALNEQGCTAYMGRTVSSYKQFDEGFIAVLDDETEVSFDFALSAVGLSPRTDLAKAAGLEVDAGIQIDRLMQTSDPNIYALGDCAQPEVGPLPFIAPLLAQARSLGATLCGKPTYLELPALPVVVKTPAFPLVVCPPPANTDGAWQVDSDNKGSIALYKDADGNELGFVLAGDRTAEQQQLAKSMPPLLAGQTGTGVSDDSGPAELDTDLPSYECDICGYVYDPSVGDPDGGIPPGTAWEDIPDDWECPTCGATKEDFTLIKG